MSRFFSSRHGGLEPYVPGEQPQDRRYVKLNTNESPFPPSEKALRRAAEAAGRLNLYSDPECLEIRRELAELCGVDTGELIVTNGSDEVLNFAFMAFCDEGCPAVFPDVTYGFYPVFAAVNNVPFREIPVDEDLKVRSEDYIRRDGGRRTLFLANPNAHTGILLGTDEIEEILRGNRDCVVVIDEAYVDFGGESCIPLIHEYDNLLVTQTFSKSRSLAGARLGFGAGCRDLIADLNTVRYSLNPYNVNSMTMAAGIGVIEDEEYTRRNCLTIMENREYASEELRRMGFEMTDSKANFIFARHPDIGGVELYRKLKERGILVRHFSMDRMNDYNRITVGSREQMDALLAAAGEILEDSEEDI